MTRNNVLENLFIYKHRKDIIKYLNKYSGKGHYDIRPLLETGGTYNLAIGEKSNGKSTAVQMVGCIIWWLYGAQSILLRTYDEDFKQGRAQGMFNGLPDGFIDYLTKGKYNCVVYKNTKWWFAKRNEDDSYEYASEPFCHRVHILNCGSSFQFPKIKLIFFDEFITKTGDYPSLWEDFQTVLSTMIRLQMDVQIFMCGNTINAHSVFFKEMGLTNIKKQKQGTIDVYQFGDSCLIACEYCGNAKAKQNNDVYWPFSNSASKMITSGAWQLNVYPHCPCEYKPKDILFTYFIIFEEQIYQCEIISTDDMDFTFIHEKSTPIQNPDEDIIFQLEEDARPNYIKNIAKPVLAIHKNILRYWQMNKVFYQDNVVGDNIQAYINFCTGKR